VRTLSAVLHTLSDTADCSHTAFPAPGTQQSRNRSPSCTSRGEAENFAFDGASPLPSQGKFWSLPPPRDASKQPSHLFLSAAWGPKKHPLGRGVCLSYSRTRTTELSSFFSCWGACGAGLNHSSELLCPLHSPLKNQHSATVISAKLPLLSPAIAP